MIALWSARDRNTCCQCEVILPVLLSNPLKWIALGPDCEYLLRPTALARRCRPGSLQASSDSSPVSERPRTTVSVGALHPGLQCWYVPASAFSQPSPTCRTAFLAERLRPSGVFSCWPDGLELTAGFYPGSNEQHRPFLGVYLKRTCSRVTSASSALRVPMIICYTNPLTHSFRMCLNGTIQVISI